MRRTRFTDPAGTVRVGDWTADGIVAAGHTYAPANVDLLPPVSPGKVLGVGENYHGALDGQPPDSPLIWLKGGPHVIAGPNSTIALPARDAVVFEAELGVVIGKEARNLSPSTALDAVAGYTCVNDLSNQAYEADPTMLRVKSFDNAAPMGPYVVPEDAVPANPRVQLRVDGETQQDSADDEFVFSVAEAVAAFSQHLTLAPDDVIMMGSPAGIDTITEDCQIEVEIEGIGTLTHDVVVP